MVHAPMAFLGCELKSVPQFGSRSVLCIGEAWAINEIDILLRNTSPTAKAVPSIMDIPLGNVNLNGDSFKS